MSKPLVSDDLWEAIAPLLPRERPKLKGGCPRCDDRQALAGIIFVLHSGIPWEMLPREFGCSGMTYWRRVLDWQTAGVWVRLHRVLLERLSDEGQLDWSRASPDSAAVPEKRGHRDRPEPDGSRQTAHKAPSCGRPRGHPARGRLSPPNWHDSLMLVPTLDAVPGVRHGRGRPRKRPDKLHADKAHDNHRCRAECRKYRVTPRIARRRVDSSERLGRHRWVVERTLAWLNRFRRLTIQYERRADIHEAFVLLGCALICLNQIRRFC